MLLFWPVGLYGIIKIRSASMKWKAIILSVVGGLIVLAIVSETSVGPY